jgi:hypothetical protein
MFPVIVLDGCIEELCELLNVTGVTEEESGGKLDGEDTVLDTVIGVLKLGVSDGLVLLPSTTDEEDDIMEREELILVTLEILESWDGAVVVSDANV